MMVVRRIHSSGWRGTKLASQLGLLEWASLKGTFEQRFEGGVEWTIWRYGGRAFWAERMVNHTALMESVCTSLCSGYVGEHKVGNVEPLSLSLRPWIRWGLLFRGTWRASEEFEKWFTWWTIWLQYWENTVKKRWWSEESCSRDNYNNSGKIQYLWGDIIEMVRNGLTWIIDFKERYIQIFW